MKRHARLTSILGCGLLGLCIPPTAAQVLEEIIVTAQKRTESLQDVPISVSVVSGEKIAQAGITKLADLATFVPNLSMNQTGIGTVIAIRGISSGINQGFEQSTGMYVDGVYYGRAQLARAPYLDLERVEVLRGPQSILFGKNTIAGAINMTTARPTQDLSGYIRGGYVFDYDERDIEAAISGSLTETLSARLTGLLRESDGYYTNTTLRRDEPQNEEQVLRLSLLWQPSDNFSALLKLEDGEFDSLGRAMEIVSPAEAPGGLPYATVLALATGGAYQLDTAQDFKRQSNGDTSFNGMENITLTLDYAFDRFELTSVTGYNAYDYEELCDCDFTGADIFTVLSNENFSQYSQELRLTSSGSQTVDWIAGLFFQSYQLNFADAFTIPTTSLLTGLSPAYAGVGSNRNYSQDSEMWAAFAQFTWNLRDDLRLTLGGRYTAEDKDGERRQYHVDANGVDRGTDSILLNTILSIFQVEPYERITASRSENNFSPLITLQYDWTAETLLYATYTTGFKAGGYDARSNAHPDPAYGVLMLTPGGPMLNPGPLGVFEFEEEEAQSFELGAKMQLADGAAELNLALFRTNYDDLQVSQFDGILGFNVTNAGEATIMGLELDGRWRLTDRLLMNGAFAYLDFEYDEFPNSQCYFGQAPNSVQYPGQCDVSGQPREYTPEFRVNLGSDYLIPLASRNELQFSLDLAYTDKYFAHATLDPRLVQDAVVEVSARVAFRAYEGKLEVALLGTNLTDKAIVTFGANAPVSTTITANAVGVPSTAYYAFYKRPRAFNLQASYRF